MNSCSSIVALFLAALLTLVPAYTSSSPIMVQPVPSTTPFPTETLNPAAFDLSGASVYQSPDGAVEIVLPSAWQAEPTYQLGQYMFGYGKSGDETSQIEIMAGQPAEIYGYLLQATTPIESPEAALEALKRQLSSDSTLKSGDIVPAKIGTLDGLGLAISITAEPAQEVEVRIASFEDGQIVLAVFWSRASLWPSARPVLYKMLDSLVIKLQNIPTATPTPTLHPLLMTATALQKQIDALTPTSPLTVSPFPTVTLLPTETLDPAALDMSRASVYKSPDGAVEILLPPGWQAPPNVMFGEYQFTSGIPGDESPQFVILIGRPAEIYKMALKVDNAVETPKAALEAFRNSVSYPTFIFGDITPAKLGTLDGYGIAISTQEPVARGLEVRIATLSDELAILVIAEARASDWQLGKPIIYKMLDSLVIRPENIPTVTPTPVK